MSGVEGLTIRSSDSTSVSIYCRIPSSLNDKGSGLMFLSVSNITITNLILKSCGILHYYTPLQYYTAIRNDTVQKYRSAVYIVNSTNINFRLVTFYRSVGRGLSLYDVDGRVQITQCKFVANAVLEEEKKQIFGGGGLSIQFTQCPPSYTCHDSEDVVHYYSGSHYKVEECVFQDNRVTDNLLPEVIQIRYKRNIAGRGGGIRVTLEEYSCRTTISIVNSRFFNNAARHGSGIYLRFWDNTRENNIAIKNCQFSKKLCT